MNIVIISKKYGLKNVLVDDEDYEKIKKYSWCARYDKNIDKFYIVARTPKSEGNKIIYIHRFIFNAEKNQMIDHINGDTFDNRKSNLRYCNKSTNGMNRGSQKNHNSSIYKGVRFDKSRKKYYARICLNQKTKFLGYYENEYQAAEVYNAAAIKLHGEFAKLNIIERDKHETYAH